MAHQGAQSQSCPPTPFHSWLMTCSIRLRTVETLTHAARRHLVVIERQGDAAHFPVPLRAANLDSSASLCLGRGPGVVAILVGFDTQGPTAERVLRREVASSVASGGPILGVGPAFVGAAGAQISLAIAAWIAENGAHREDAMRIAALVSTLSQDPTRARDFVTDTLGALADSSEGARQDRRALAAYLEAGRSLQRVARSEHVHRNTVVYRMRRATARLPGPVDGSETDILCALRILEVLGPDTLRRLGEDQP